jgi:S-DNA-T family DNA segregation ATPase FtsK/SpoIIIE
VTQFTLRPAMGVKLSQITTLSNDLALALAAHPIRIEAPIPGKPLVGIEVPNKKSAIVGLRDLFEADDYKKSRYSLPLVLGRDVAGFPVFSALEKMPHLLIAGATGTGKSVAINAILLSLLYRHSPNVLKLIMVDPKRVELSLYNGIPHLITPVIVDTKKVVNALRWSVREMEKRYEKLSESGSRDIFSYNAKQATAQKEIMPFIVIVIDELADLMAAHGRDVEAAIVRIAQMARAVGIHLIVSTQRPSVEVITGLIKANITTRMAFQVASQVDSRTILDMAGAEKLLGSGDMLYQAGDTSKPRRLQGAFVTEKEVKDVVRFIKQQAEQLEEEGETSGEPDKLKLEIDENVSEGSSFGDDDSMGDSLFFDAKEVVAQAGKASASLLQRRLKVGYARAARLLDLLEERGIIGPGEGAKAREVYIGREATPREDNFVDDGSVAEVASSDSKLDDKIATEE